MDYKLAKELKDSGFPQGPYQRILDEVKENPDRAPAYLKEFRVTTMDNLAIRPTLSELIEACGNGFYELHRLGLEGGFLASDGSNIGVLGTTPEEAVARLYLHLKQDKMV